MKSSVDIGRGSKARTPISPPVEKLLRTFGCGPWVTADPGFSHPKMSRIDWMEVNLPGLRGLGF